jgi:hypothetical protein
MPVYPVTYARVRRPRWFGHYGTRFSKEAPTHRGLCPLRYSCANFHCTVEAFREVRP